MQEGGWLKARAGGVQAVRSQGQTEEVMCSEHHLPGATEIESNSTACDKQEENTQNLLKTQAERKQSSNLASQGPHSDGRHENHSKSDTIKLSDKPLGCLQTPKFHRMELLL